MKTRYLVLFLLILFFSCNIFRSDEDIAKANIIKELKPTLRNPESFVFESIEPIILTSEKQELKKEIRGLEIQLEMNKRENWEFKEMSVEELEEYFSIKKRVGKQLDSLQNKYLFMYNPGKRWKEAVLHYRAENGFGGMNKGVVRAKLGENLEVLHLEDVSDIYVGF